MKRKHFFLLMFHLCFALLVAGQQYSPNNLYGVSMPRGLFMTSLGIPQDTATLDPYARMYPHIARKGGVTYFWSVPQQKWVPEAANTAVETDPNFAANGVPKSRVLTINGESHTLDSDPIFTIVPPIEGDPVYLANGVPKSRMIWINGEGHDLTSDPSFTIPVGSGSAGTRWANTMNTDGPLADPGNKEYGIFNLTDTMGGVYQVTDSIIYHSDTRQVNLASFHKHLADAFQWVINDTITSNGQTSQISTTEYPDHFESVYHLSAGANNISNTLSSGFGNFQADGAGFDMGGTYNVGYGFDLAVNTNNPTGTWYTTSDLSQSYAGTWIKESVNVLELKAPVVAIQDYSADGSNPWYLGLNLNGFAYFNSKPSDVGDGASEYTWNSTDFTGWHIRADVFGATYTDMSLTTAGDAVLDYTNTVWIKKNGTGQLYLGADGMKVEAPLFIDNYAAVTDPTGYNVVLLNPSTNQVSAVPVSSLGGSGGGSGTPSWSTTVDGAIAFGDPGTVISQRVNLLDNSANNSGNISTTDSLDYYASDGESYHSYVIQNVAGINMLTTWKEPAGWLLDSVVTAWTSWANQYSFTVTSRLQSDGRSVQGQISQNYGNTMIFNQVGSSQSIVELDNDGVATPLITLWSTYDVSNAANGSKVSVANDLINIKSASIEVRGRLNLSADTAPTNSSDTSGADGDFIVDTSGNLYLKQGGTWHKFAGASF